MIDYTKKQALIVTAHKPLVDWLLSINTHNRSVKISQVNAIRQEIKDGRFLLTNQGVGVTATGWLTDGQHRLLGIKEEGYPPVELLVVTGLDDMSQVVVDRHSKRTSADVIRLVLNQTVSNQVVAAVSLMHRVKSGVDGFFLTSKKISEIDMADFIGNNHEALERLMPAIGSSMRAGVVAALIEFALSYSIDDACDLAEKVKVGADLSLTSPAFRLRNWMERNRVGGGSAQLASYSAAVTACIAHARSEGISLLKPSRSWDRLPKKLPKKGLFLSDPMPIPIQQ